MDIVHIKYKERLLVLKPLSNMAESKGSHVVQPIQHSIRICYIKEILFPGMSVNNYVTKILKNKQRESFSIELSKCTWIPVGRQSFF